MPEQQPQNKWTVPEANDIEVLFRYTSNGQLTTKGFRIPAYIARALNQFCVDNNRLTEQDEPDTLGLFAEVAYGKVLPDGKQIPGLVLTILDRYKDYPGIQSAQLTEAKAKAEAAAADLAAAVAAAAAAGLQPISE